MSLNPTDDDTLNLLGVGHYEAVSTPYKKKKKIEFIRFWMIEMSFILYVFLT